MDRLARSFIDLHCLVDDLTARDISGKFLKEGQTYSLNSTPVAKRRALPALELAGRIKVGQKLSQVSSLPRRASGSMLAFRKLRSRAGSKSVEPRYTATSDKGNSTKFHPIILTAEQIPRKSMRTGAPINRLSPFSIRPCGLRYAQTGAALKKMTARLGRSSPVIAMRYQDAGARDDELARRAAPTACMIRLFTI